MTENRRGVKSLFDYVRNTNVIALLFICAEFTRVLGFLPEVPAAAAYCVIALYAVYCIAHTRQLDGLYIALLAYIPIEILIISPQAMFSPWLRYGLLALVLVTGSGMCQSVRLREQRNRIFNIACFGCALIGVGSFICYFLGINYMPSFYNEQEITTGLFGGLTGHSMMLGPTAGVGAICLVSYARLCKGNWKSRLLLLCALLCVGSVMFSSSRSAFLATIAGMLVYIQLVSKNLGKLLKTLTFILVIAACTMPLWQGAMAGLMDKQEKNEQAGSAFASREDKWEQRMREFESSPVFGYGFAAVDPANKDNSVGMGGKVVEAGSSWLSVLSMTGVIGFVLIMCIYIKSLRAAYYHGKNPLLISALALLSVNMCTEGYIFFGGSFLAFLFWITVGVCYDQKYTRA